MLTQKFLKRLVDRVEDEAYVVAQKQNRDERDAISKPLLVLGGSWATSAMEFLQGHGFFKPSDVAFADLYAVDQEGNPERERWNLKGTPSGDGK